LRRRRQLPGCGLRRELRADPRLRRTTPTRAESEWSPPARVAAAVRQMRG
jgi:hypothetical protein